MLRRHPIPVQIPRARPGSGTPVCRPRLAAARVALTASLAALAALRFASPAAAQQSGATIDLGGVGVRYADTIRASGPTISPAARAEWDRATVSAAGTFAQLGSGWSTNGSVATSIYTPAARSVLGELAAVAGGSSNADGATTAQALGVARAHVMRATGGVWLGGGGGRVWDGFLWRTTLVGEGGAWALRGPLVAVATVTPTRVADTIRYTDSQLAGRLALAHFEFGAAAGVRTGRRLPAYGGPATSWGSVSATAWVAPWAGLVATAGTYPVDLTQGFPGGRFVAVALRIGSRGARAITAGTPRTGTQTGAGSAESEEAARAGVRAFRTADVGQRLRIEVLAPAARRIEVAGDFTSWTPVALRRSTDGWWTVTLPVARGTYQTNLRVDGSRWVVPPGLTAVRDEFGGTVGILVVR